MPLIDGKFSVPDQLLSRKEIDGEPHLSKNDQLIESDRFRVFKYEVSFSHSSSLLSSFRKSTANPLNVLRILFARIFISSDINPVERLFEHNRLLYYLY